MLQEGREIFRKLLSESNGLQLLLDNYVLKQGTYRLIYMHDDKEWTMSAPVDIGFDKKTQSMIGFTDSNYRIFQALDYYSKLLEMNKPIDQKKTIHSNNYLSLAIKKDQIKDKEIDDDLRRYYRVLSDPLLKYNKKNTRLLYQNVEKELGPVDISLLEQIKDYALSHNLFEDIPLDRKDYVKIFFVFDDMEKTREFYIRENKRYLYCNLFNNNDYNVTDKDGNLWGLPNDNMGLNGKKPYLEHKTRKNTVPILMSQEDTMLQMQMFDYLQSFVSKGKKNVYIDMEKKAIHFISDQDENNLNVSSGYYLRCEPEKNETAIVNVIPIVNFNQKLDHPLEIINYMEIPYERLETSSSRKLIKYDYPYWRLNEICSAVNFTFFEGKLTNNYWTDPKDVSLDDAVIKRCLLENREILSQWFLTGETMGVLECFDRFSFTLIKRSIEKNRWLDAQKQLNLRWSLLNYFDIDDQRGENFMDIREALRNHINLNKYTDWQFSSDQEYAYGVGQIASYFWSLNKSKNKDFSFVNQLLNARTKSEIDRKLVRLFKKYNYQIKTKGRGTVLLDHILRYEPKIIDIESIVAGFVAPSLIYEKIEKEEEE